MAKDIGWRTIMGRRVYLGSSGKPTTPPSGEAVDKKDGSVTTASGIKIDPSTIKGVQSKTNYSGKVSFGGGATEEEITHHLRTTFGLKNKTINDLISATAPEGHFDKVNIRFMPSKNAFVVKATSSKDPDALMVREVRKGDRGIEVHNINFDIGKDFRGAGLGTSVFADQIDGARKLGVSQFKAIAGRGEGENGYYTWPRLGYDAPRSGLSTKIPDAIKGETLSQVMANPEGRSWWLKNGGGSELLTFDLDSKSTSSMVFSNYLKEKGR